jgi:phosphatidylinositol-3-phosphatase
MAHHPVRHLRVTRTRQILICVRVLILLLTFSSFGLILTGCSGLHGSNAAPTVNSAQPAFGHVFIVVEENHNYSDVIGSSSMLYLNSLATQYGLATQYYANTHPSIGNYFMLTAGQIVTNNDSYGPPSGGLDVDNVARELLTAGKTWKAYEEGMLSPCFLESTSDNTRTHDPLSYFSDVIGSSVQCQNLVPFTQFATDLANNQLPNYSFITPNLIDDAHDGTLQQADTWLRVTIDPLIKSQEFQKDGLLIIVFDESGSDNRNGGGRVVAVLISPSFSKAAYQSTTPYQHQSVLRLMLEGLGVNTLPGAAATAPKMWEFFTFPPPS